MFFNIFFLSHSPLFSFVPLLSFVLSFNAYLSPSLFFPRIIFISLHSSLFIFLAALDTLIFSFFPTILLPSCLSLLSSLLFYAFRASSSFVSTLVYLFFFATIFSLIFSFFLTLNFLFCLSMLSFPLSAFFYFHSCFVRKLHFSSLS